jgi:hypothetical protein
LVAAKLESIRETLENLKSMTVGVPPTILSYSKVREGVGFNKYWEREEKYMFEKFYKGVTNEANETKQQVMHIQQLLLICPGAGHDPTLFPTRCANTLYDAFLRLRLLRSGGIRQVVLHADL